MRYLSHVDFPLRGRLTVFAPVRWSRPQPGRYFSHRFGSIAGKLSSHRRKSSLRINVRLPCFRAQSSPVRIASYTRVLPMREAAQASAIVIAIGSMSPRIRVADVLGGHTRVIADARRI